MILPQRMQNIHIKTTLSFITTEQVGNLGTECSFIYVWYAYFTDDHHKFTLGIYSIVFWLHTSLLLICSTGGIQLHSYVCTMQIYAYHNNLLFGRQQLFGNFYSVPFSVKNDHRNCTKMTRVIFFRVNACNVT